MKKLLFLDSCFSTLKCILNVCWFYKLDSNGKINGFGMVCRKENIFELEPMLHWLLYSVIKYTGLEWYAKKFCFERLLPKIRERKNSSLNDYVFWAIFSEEIQMAEGIGSRVVFQVAVRCRYFSLLSTSMDNVNILINACCY